mmetsp:Transcript_4409/g.6433  ORF Transcript_4409/g.6433 Transcript_4409/m.6433 type:complete len:245 (+) Transcript_4409:573-1307(+)|eukprot:CAMPEP_0170490230 /NCGR_PEP_ID=MMETSP0208-20121228/8459_1 /TAXON_ID=197538 /ORGANISM="Strombidium inclinatum, Strain S3" /LENGTH=244 /DNA_ID=CAMNT_0010765521 /DNA_START=571 /DNA_END=1305 /DNA_ORIENTATION=-
MAAEDALLLVGYDGSQGHVLEGLVDFGEDGVGVGDILAQLLGALITEAEILVDALVLVVASEEHDLLGELELKSEEQADNFQTELALIYVIAEEYVIIGVDVAVLSWGLPDVEEAHQVHVLSVDITDDLHGRTDLLDHDGLGSQDLAALIGEFNDVLSLAREVSSDLDFLALFSFKQRLKEHLAERVVRVFIGLARVLGAGVQLLWLFSQLVDRNLADDEVREVLNLGLLVVGLGLSGDVSLVG